MASRLAEEQRRGGLQAGGGAEAKLWWHRVDLGAGRAPAASRRSGAGGAPVAVPSSPAAFGFCFVGDFASRCWRRPILGGYESTVRKAK